MDTGEIPCSLYFILSCLPIFLENFYSVLERAWLKTDSILVLGDINCCMLEAQNNPGSNYI